MADDTSVIPPSGITARFAAGAISDILLNVYTHTGKETMLEHRLGVIDKLSNILGFIKPHNIFFDTKDVKSTPSVDVNESQNPVLNRLFGINIDIKTAEKIRERTGLYSRVRITAPHDINDIKRTLYTETPHPVNISKNNAVMTAKTEDRYLRFPVFIFKKATGSNVKPINIPACNPLTATMW